MARIETFVLKKGDQLIANRPPLPFELVISNSVEYVIDTESGEMVVRAVPKVNQLFATLVFELAHCRHPLSADELRFMRESMGISRGDLSQRLNLHYMEIQAFESGAPISGAYECDFRDFICVTATHAYPHLELLEKKFNVGHYRELCSVNFPDRPTFDSSAHQTSGRAQMVTKELEDTKIPAVEWRVEIVKTPIAG
jgi:DNA-binding transcriptional regulator YiaG